MAKDSQSDSWNMRQQRTHTARRFLVTIAWVLGGIIATVVIAAALFVSLVNVDGVHRYLLELAQRKATAALGVPVTLENFTVDVPALRVDLYGLVIDGAAPYRTPPLLQVNHIAASVRIVSIFRGKWYLDSVEADRPVVWTIEGKHGESNLPALHTGRSNSNIDLFSLAIRHMTLTHGQLYFNDRPQSLSARISDLEMSARYDPSAQSYAGHLAYGDGQIQFGAMRPFAHALDAHFAYMPDLFLLRHAALMSGHSRIDISGEVKDFSAPHIRIKYDAAIDAGEMRKLTRKPALPSGSIEAKGTVTYIHDPSKPLLETLTVIGDASSKALTISMHGRSVPVRNLFTSYSAAGGEVTLRVFRANLLGGTVTMEGTDSLYGTHPSGSAKAELRGFSLGDMERLLQVSSPAPVALSGRLDGKAAAWWGPNFKHLKANIDASTKGQFAFQVQRTPDNQQAGGVATTSTSSEGARMPLQAEVHALYTLDNNRLTLTNTYLQTQGTQLTLNGTVGRTSTLAVDLKSNELGSLATLSSLFLKPQSSEQLRSMGVTGDVTFHGAIAGSLATPQVSGALTASNLTVAGSRWRSLHAHLGISPSSFTVEHAYLTPASQGSIQFSTHVALTRWSFSKNSAVQAAVTLSRIKVSDLMRLAGRTLPVTGILNAELQLRGSMARPSGSGRLQLTNAEAYRQPVKSAVFTVSSADGEVRGSSVVDIAGGRVTAKGSLSPVQRTYSGTIRSRGIQIGQLHIQGLESAHIAGELLVNADGHGFFDNPEMNANIQIPKGSIDGRALSEMNLKVNLDNRALSATLSSSLEHVPLTGRANVALSGNYMADLSLDTGKLSLQPLLALYAPDAAEQIAGETQVHLQLHGPIKNRQAIVGEVTIPLLKVSYKNVAEVQAASIQMDYRDGVIRVKPTEIRGTDTDLKLQGTVPIFSKAPMSLQVLGNVNLKLAQLLYPGLRASGTARIDIRSGAASPGGMGGQIEIVNASLASAGFPVGLQNGSAVLALSGDRIDVTKFDGTIGGGSVTVQGGVSFRPKVRFDLGLKASNVRMLYPQGMREDLNANLRLTGSTEQALLGGSVGISDISFTPGFDLISMAGQFSSGVSAPTAPGFAQNLALDISVQSTNTLSPSNRIMSIAGTAALSVRGTAAHPALIGRVNLTGGSMIFHGNRFVLSSGTVQFVNPNQIRPVLNLSLTTTIQQYDIDLRFTGPADQLRGEYTSNPSLPRADIISLLAFGTTTEAQGRNPTPTNQLIASQVSSQVTSRISKIAGISQLSINPVLTSGTAAGPPGAVITIRQQVTGNLFVTFSTNVASAQDQTIQGQYRLSPRVSISATRDPNGGFAIDALIKKSW